MRVKRRPLWKTGWLGLALGVPIIALSCSSSSTEPRASNGGVGGASAGSGGSSANVAGSASTRPSEGGIASAGESGASAGGAHESSAGLSNAGEGGASGASSELGGAGGEDSNPSSGAGGVNSGGTSGAGGNGGSSGAGGSAGSGGAAGNGGAGGSAGSSGAGAGGSADTNGMGGMGGSSGSMSCTPFDFGLPPHTGAPATSADVQAILDNRCTYCHTRPIAPMGLDLTNVVGVVGQPSQECTAKLRIKAGSAGESYLMDKVLHAAQNPCTCFEGEGMPFDDDPLTNDELSTLQSWINAGAN